jgi:predicted nucleotidyltransferase
MVFASGNFIINDGEQMKDQILEILNQIEEQFKVHIIYACEAGSRMWALHHENSDYDVRFLFVYPEEHYLSIEGIQEVIELTGFENIEFTGWDIRKALQLLKKQNPSIIEWIHSEEEYINKLYTKEKLLALHRQFFFEKPLLHHYSKMATTNYALLEKKFSIKLLLNVIRPLLLCQWIMKYSSFPAVGVSKIADNIELGAEKEIINKVISLKKTGKDIPFEIDGTLSGWIDRSVSKIKGYIESNDYIPRQSIYVQELNTFFRNVVKEAGKQNE